MAHDDQAAAKSIESALTADPLQALSRLREAWLETRSTVLRDLVLQLGLQLASVVPKPTGKTDKAFVQAWVDRLRSIQPGPVGTVLLQSVVRDLVPLVSSWTAASLLPCLDAMAKMENEACLSSLAAALLQTRHGVDGFTTAAMKLHKRGLALAVASGDVAGARAMLTEYQSSIPQPVTTGTAAIAAATVNRLAQLAKVKTIETPEAPWFGLKAQIEKVRPTALPERAPSAVTTEGELLARVAENASDEETLAVLADLWSEQSNPRGEFLTLQLRVARGEATPAQEARATSLLEKHKKTWLGPLAGVVVLGTVKFERGFLSSCSLAPKNQSQLDVFQSDPIWRTVKRLSAVRADWLTKELRSLETLTVGTFAFFSTARMKMLPQSVRHVAVLEWYHEYMEGRLSLLLASAPNLKTFGCAVANAELESGKTTLIEKALGQRVKQRTIGPIDVTDLHGNTKGIGAFSSLATFELG